MWHIEKDSTSEHYEKYEIIVHTYVYFKNDCLIYQNPKKKNISVQNLEQYFCLQFILTLL